MEAARPSELFDAYYYAHGCGRPYQRDDEWLGFFSHVAQHITQKIQPRTVLDAGCAMGFLVEQLRGQGVEAWGFDISPYAIANVAPEIQPYCWVGSATEPLQQRYDLIVSIEVLEHMAQDEAERAVANLCLYTDDVLFSSTPFDYKEATHFNVQPPEYWAELFALQGFYRDVDFDASFLTPWAVRFRRSAEPPHRLARDYERRFWLLWKENTDLRSLISEMRAGLADAEATNERVRALEAHIAGVERGRVWRLMAWVNRALAWVRERMNRG
jgi:hypothetical protein